MEKPQSSKKTFQPKLLQEPIDTTSTESQKSKGQSLTWTSLKVNI